MQRSNDLVLCCNNANPVAIVKNLSIGFLLFSIFIFFNMRGKSWWCGWFFFFFKLFEFWKNVTLHVTIVTRRCVSTCLSITRKKCESYCCNNSLWNLKVDLNKFLRYVALRKYSTQFALRSFGRYLKDFYFWFIK